MRGVAFQILLEAPEEFAECDDFAYYGGYYS